MAVPESRNRRIHPLVAGVAGAVLALGSATIAQQVIDPGPSDSASASASFVAAVCPSGMSVNTCQNLRLKALEDYATGATPSPSPSPSASPSVTPSPSSSPSTASPTPTSASPTPTSTTTGFPTAATTGVPAGTALTSFTGTLTVTTPGTVIDARDIKGCIVIQASNVTVKRTRVAGSSCVNSHQIDTGDGQYTGIVLQDVEVDGQNTSSFGAGIGNTGFTCIRCNIHNVGQGVHLDSDGGMVDSYIHDLWGSGNPATTGSHNEAIFAGGGSNLVIRGNELQGRWAPGHSGGGMSSSLAMYGWLAPQNNVVVDRNRFSAAEGYCVYAGATHDYPNPVNVRFTNNRFVRYPGSTCGQYGPVTAYKSGSGNVWTGNVWDDTGAAINP